jgi:nucleotide-binding universal stress UspA family protein
MIVPTDGSDHATKAVGLAADLAGKYEARLVIVHALLRGETPGGLRALCERLGAPADLVARLDDEAAQMVTTMASAYAEVPVILPLSKELLESVGQLVCDRARDTAQRHGATDVTVTVVDGAPADTILAAAKHENADMIVMGSRGLGRFEGLLLGAVSQRVNHLATCTCVTVK